VSGNGHGPGVPLALVVGNPKPGSRTLQVARWVTDLIHDGLDRAGVRVGEPDLVDLAELGAHLLSGLPGRNGVDDGTGSVDLALLRVRTPGLLVVASPTFKGTYSGLLKLFLDLLPRTGLTGTVAVPVMTAAFSSHRFAVDTYLRALLVELGACVPTRGVSVIERDFAQLDAAVADWAQASLSVLAAVLRHEWPAHAEKQNPDTKVNVYSA
jgi:FMN reductase